MRRASRIRLTLYNVVAAVERGPDRVRQMRSGPEYEQIFGLRRPARGYAGGPERFALVRPARTGSNVPSGAGVGDAAATDHAGPVHFPNSYFAARILPQDVGTAVLIIIARPHEVPARSGVADAAAADHARPVHFPYGGFPAAVLP